jgi:hypothetical protein
MATKSNAVDPATLEPFRQNDPTLHWMMNNNVPLTREDYIDMAYGGTPPQPWTQEHESQLPGPLQDGAKVADQGG